MSIKTSNEHPMMHRPAVKYRFDTVTFVSLFETSSIEPEVMLPLVAVATRKSLNVAESVAVP